MLLWWSLHVLVVIHYILIDVAFGQTTLKCESPNPKIKNCNCTVKGLSFPTAINLCSLDKEFHHVLAKQQIKPSSINVLRYWILNAFRRIESPKAKIQNTTTGNPCGHESLSKTNCPIYSMCCLVSCVSSECNDERESSNDAVCIAPQLNADAYGHYGKWRIRQPMKSDSDVQGSVAVIQINAGHCYFCDIRGDGTLRDLYTLIGLYCDERIVDQGHPLMVDHPRRRKPRLVFHWNTSYACYEFINLKDQTCNSIEQNVCTEDKTFSCSSQNYHFRFPYFANHSIKSRKKTENVEYTFGFCAKDIDDCSSTDTIAENGVMICKNQTTPVAYYKDSIAVIIRPTGFVWRIRDYSDDTLKAVVSFQCSDQSSEKIELNVLDQDKKLPVLLILKHKCFCPNPDKICQGSSIPTPNPYINPTTKPLQHFYTLVIGLIVVGILVIVCGISVLWYVHNRRTPVRQPTPSNTSTSSEADPLSDSPPSSSYYTPPSSLPGLLSRTRRAAITLTNLDPVPTERTPFLDKYKKLKRHR